MEKHKALTIFSALTGVALVIWLIVYLTGRRD